jgi:hypothetical protein
MWIIANFPIEYLENNKPGSKKTEKKEKWILILRQ